jgi:hypothetical protein
MAKENWIVWVHWREWWNCYLCEHYADADPKKLICGELGSELVANKPMFTLEDVIAAARMQGLRYMLCPECTKASEEDEEGDSAVIVRDTGEVLRQGTRPLDESLLKHIIFAELSAKEQRSPTAPATTTSNDKPSMGQTIRGLHKPRKQEEFESDDMEPY